MGGSERKGIRDPGPLEIAVLCFHSSPLGKAGGKDTGGMSTYLRELCGEMGSQGARVDIYVRSHGDSQIVPLGTNARLIPVMAGPQSFIPKQQIHDHLPEFVANVEAFRARENRRYHVIFSHYWLSALAGQRLKEKWQTPNLVMFHTLGASKNITGTGYREPRIRLLSEAEIVEGCDGIIAPSLNERRSLIKRYGANPNKVSVIPCGVNTNRFRPLDRKASRKIAGFGANDEILLFIGRLEPIKGIDRLLQTVALLQHRPRLRAIIIGSDDEQGIYREELGELARNLGIEPRVSFIGIVDHSDLPLYYNSADFSFVPSHYESFCLVALESLACGVPVIGTPVGALPEMIDDGRTGYVVTEFLPSALASLIEKALLCPSLKPPWDIHASVSHMDWPSVARRTIEECMRISMGPSRG